MHYYAGENESPKLTMSEMGRKEEAMEGPPTKALKQTASLHEYTGDLWGPQSILTESLSE